MQLFFLAVYLFEALIAFVYFFDNFKLKRSLPATFAILTVLYLAAFAVNILDNNINIINDVAFFSVNMIFGMLCFEISLKSCIFHSSFLLAVMFLTELVAEAGISALLKIPIDAYKTNLAALFIIGTISKILYLIVCKIVSSLFSYKKISENARKRQATLFLYPIIVTITLTLFLYASTKYNFSKTLNLICAIVCCVSLVFCCFIFIYNNVIQRQEAELITLQAERQRNEINKTFYDLLEKKNEEQRILVHDMRHHFSAISGMESTEEIKSYLSKVQTNLDEYRYIGKMQQATVAPPTASYKHLIKIMKAVNIIYSLATYITLLTCAVAAEMYAVFQSADFFPISFKIYKILMIAIAIIMFVITSFFIFEKRDRIVTDRCIVSGYNMENLDTFIKGLAVSFVPMIVILALIFFIIRIAAIALSAGADSEKGSY